MPALAPSDSVITLVAKPRIPRSIKRLKQRSRGPSRSAAMAMSPVPDVPYVNPGHVGPHRQCVAGVCV
jgi:hypothetical protein